MKNSARPRQKRKSPTKKVEQRERQEPEKQDNHSQLHHGPQKRDGFRRGPTTTDVITRFVLSGARFPRAVEKTRPYRRQRDSPRAMALSITTSSEASKKNIAADVATATAP